MAPRNALIVEEIFNWFPNPVLPKVDHEPTFEDIKITIRLLNTNEIPVPSISGGGAHGHLGTIMTPMEYAVISATPWAEPRNPGPIPSIAHGTDPVDAAQLACLHDEFRRIHANLDNVEQALKRIILEAFDNMNTSQLENYLLQYANRPVLEMFLHLCTTYFFINPTQIVDNYNKMKATISLQELIQMLLKKLRMESGIEAQYVNIASSCSLTQAPSLRLAENGNGALR
jgi:hypothetical protein